MGYHIIELINRIKDSQLIKIYDTNENIYKKVKSEKQIINILSKSNVKVYNRKNLKEFCETLNLSNDIIINKPLIKVCLDNDIERLIDNYVISKFGINKFKDIMMNNEIINSKIHYKNICDFFQIFSSKIKLIVSSRLSLDLLINDIKNIEIIMIYVVGSALSTLIKNNITPNAIVIIDSQGIVAN